MGHLDRNCSADLHTQDRFGRSPDFQGGVKASTCNNRQGKGHLPENCPDHAVKIYMTAEKSSKSSGISNQ
jgi:hypothetical protein